jgi:hypothetical protein
LEIFVFLGNIYCIFFIKKINYQNFINHEETLAKQE